MLLRILRASIMYLNFNVQEEDVLEHKFNAKCHLVSTFSEH